MPLQLTYRDLFDAMPIPVFVVDAEIQIVDVNQAGAEFCNGTKADLRMRRGGEVLHCLHATESPGGCGKGPSCRSCVIRDVVTNCLRGSTIRRRRLRLETLNDQEQCSQFELLLTASPVLEPNGLELALLIVEDITEVSSLKDIIPICMNCKKIRDDDRLWQDVDAYFQRHLGVDFSHGVCPGCRQNMV